MTAKPIRIGTRGSQLALWQARWVKNEIGLKWPQKSVELVIIKTQGDKIIDVPLAKIGGKGLFVKEIEDALMSGRIDLAVHSMKDMPVDLPEGLAIGAVPRREIPLDALIANGYSSLSQLPKDARVGTSSLRRSAQLLNLRPDLVIIPLRGNLDTRLRKLDENELDAIVLAAAGLKRLGLAHHVSTYLEPDQMLPAVGQGALCIEYRDQDPDIAPRLSFLDHADSRIAVTAERAFLHRLEGGCQVPMAAYGQISGSQLSLSALVAEVDGSRMLKTVRTGRVDQAEAIGTQAAEELLAQGAAAILERIQSHVP